MLEKYLKELCDVIGEYREIGAWLTPEGITVEIRGTFSVRRDYPLFQVSSARFNILLSGIDEMRKEVENPLDS